MRVAVTGASGNCGSALVERLVSDDAVEEVVGVCRRPHDWRPPRTRWVFADVGSDDLTAAFRGVDTVVHLAWLFHPTRDPRQTWQANAVGSQRVLDAAAAAGVPAVVSASSVGAYAARADLSPVDEGWPTSGWPTAAYSREKAYVERVLDAHEARHPEQRVVRLRPAFVFQRRAALEQRRIFLGPWVPHALLHRGRLPAVPIPRSLHLQAVHADDLADAYARAVTRPVSGAFNVAADGVLDPDTLAELLGTRAVPVPDAWVRGAISAAFAARLVPAEPGLVELALHVPVMSSTRARTELGWEPRHDAREALTAFLEGIEEDVDGPRPPLAAETSGPGRRHEVATGVGARA